MPRLASFLKQQQQQQQDAQPAAAPAPSPSAPQPEQCTDAPPQQQQAHSLLGDAPVQDGIARLAKLHEQVHPHASVPEPSRQVRPHTRQSSLATRIALRAISQRVKQHGPRTYRHADGSLRPNPPPRAALTVVRRRCTAGRDLLRGPGRSARDAAAGRGSGDAAATQRPGEGGRGARRFDACVGAGEPQAVARAGGALPADRVGARQQPAPRRVRFPSHAHASLTGPRPAVGAGDGRVCSHAHATAP